MRSPHPAEGMYGSLRHLVKPILEKISVATRTWTASLKPTNSSLVPTSLKTWYPRSLLLTAGRPLQPALVAVHRCCCVFPAQGCSIAHHETQGTSRKSCPNCRRLQTKLDAQEARLKALEATVARLQEQLAAARKDSSTSSKPPSSDTISQFRGHHTQFFGVMYGVPGTT